MTDLLAAPDDFMLDQWPRKGRGGWFYNQHEERLVVSPKSPNRVLIYDGASGLLKMGKPYRGDPRHGLRGTHVHTLCGYALRGEQPPAELVAEGVELDIPADLQRHIYRAFIDTRAALGIGYVDGTIEACFVRDAWRVASNVDWLDLVIASGIVRAADGKSSRDVMDANHAVQLAAAAGSVRYNPDTGERTPWSPTLDPNVGHIWWYPLAEALKADPGDWPTWRLVEVDLRHGHQLGNTLAALKYDSLRRSDFQVVPLSERSSRPTGHNTDVADRDDTAPTVPTGRDSFSPDEPTGSTGGAGLTITTTPDGLHASKVLTPAEQKSWLPAAPSEGSPVPAAEFQSLKITGYDQLSPDQRAWVNALEAEARKERVSFHTKGHHTARRYHIMRALIMLARAELTEPDAVRGLLANLRPECAYWPALTVGHLIGSLDADEAHQFAGLAADVVAT
jgi:hypothetical protein